MKCWPRNFGAQRVGEGPASRGIGRHVYRSRSSRLGCGLWVGNSGGGCCLWVGNGGGSRCLWVRDSTGGWNSLGRFCVGTLRIGWVRRVGGALVGSVAVGGRGILISVVFVLLVRVGLVFVFGQGSRSGLDGDGLRRRCGLGDTERFGLGNRSRWGDVRERGHRLGRFGWVVVEIRNNQNCQQAGKSSEDCETEAVSRRSTYTHNSNSLGGAVAWKVSLGPYSPIGGHPGTKKAAIHSANEPTITAISILRKSGLWGSGAVVDPRLTIAVAKSRARR